jgi:hypothetical protein
LGDVIYTYVVVLAIVAFAILGVLRGWLREIAALGGLLLAWLAVLAAGGALVAGMNHLWLMVSFTLAGGFDSTSPGTVLDSLRRAPLVDPRHPDVVLGVAFIGLAAVAFVAASRYAPPATAISARALGLLVGIANGYLLSYLCLRFLAPAARVGLSLPINPGPAVDALGHYLPTLLLLGVGVAIVIALLSSKRLGGKSAVRPVPGRLRG